MKRVVVGVSLCASLLLADITALPNSWQMVGSGIEQNLSENPLLSAQNFTIVWTYEDGKWYGYSKDSALAARLKELGLYREKVCKNGAFWILAKENIKFIPFESEIEFFPNKKGWNMFSSSYFHPVNIGVVQGNLKGLFTYRGGKWDYLYRFDNNTTIGNLHNIAPGEGAWALLKENQQTTLQYYYSGYCGDFYANTTLQSENLTLSLDQNGTVISNNPSMNGMQWNVDCDSYGWGTVLTFWSDTRAYRIRLQNGYTHTIDDIIELNITQYPTGVVQVHSAKRVALSYPFDYNLSSYNKDKPTDETVRQVIQDIKNLFDNGAIDAKTIIDKDMTTLQGLDSNDARVARALLNFIYLLDLQVLQDDFVIESNPLSINTFFSAIKNGIDPIDNLEYVQNISDYQGDARELLKDLAQRMEKAADDLAQVEADKNYIFHCEILGKDSFNYADIKAVRVVLYLAAYQLHFLAAYQLGNDYWLAPVQEGQYEYERAAADPVGFLNSKTFFVNPDHNELTRAKNDLTKALQNYYELLDKKYDDKGLEVKQKAVNGKNAKRIAYMLLQNITGKAPYAIVDDESVDWTAGGKKVSQERALINLNALFDPATALTIDDFPTFKYRYPYDPERSKKHNEAFSTRADGAEAIVVDEIPDHPTHINKFILKVYTADGRVLEGKALLDELFKE